MFDTRLAAEAQAKYCQERGYPNFAPCGGGCYHCGRDIYKQIVWPDGNSTGITVESAGHGLVTGCPHCHYRFCE